MTTKPAANMAFAHALADAWLCAVAAVGLGLILLLAWAVAWLPWYATGLLALLAAFLVNTNYQCVAHNFVHNQFFRSRAANACFSVFNSLALGAPQTMFREHHIGHHRYNNASRSADGFVGDMSSLFLYSAEPGRPESLWRYSLLGPFRPNPLALARAAFLHSYGWRLSAEMVVLAVFWTGLLAFDWRYVLFVYAPIWYLGHVTTYAEGYFEHYKSTPGNRLADAVSCYGRLYNLLWFNNGYHQEHHYRPHVHWTQVKALRSEMLPESERRVVQYAHCFNF